MFGTYLLLINFITFAVFGIDKYRAVKQRFRIRESVLLGLAALGGSVGGLAGMYVFRHKTRKNRFRVGIPMILAVQATVIWAVR